ncbi:MAG: hypothetical protein M8841_00915 [marine benthic group bacterium]|nr:hypothetical protein [Gemmatimonadota bacterium]MCL7937758.1 hypothetical protein [Gemmatimonadota bacterium]MCL7966484.1 hypothetical protein [Gemmatimonadota bacterium]MCL7978814.1 hypothetical protein [Gemmatimonadota bacterium]
MTHRANWTRFRLITIILLPSMGSIAGCQTWAEVPPPFQTWIAESQAEHLRVVSGDTELELRDTSVLGDILSGTVEGSNERVEVSCSTISRIRAKQIDGRRTTGAVSIGTLAAALVASIIAGASG